MFDSLKIGLFATYLLYAVGDAVPKTLPGLGSLTQMGALGVLAWTVWTQQTELREMRRIHSDVIEKLCERWDAWEQIRHNDSEKLDGTLREMTANCAAVQSRMNKE